jgi:hypothetical protein
VKLCQREVGEPPYSQFAVKISSKHRLRKKKMTIMSEEGGGMIVKTGEDMVRLITPDTDRAT